MSKRAQKKGRFFITTGLLLIAAALILTAYNLWTDMNAGKVAEKVLMNMMPASENSSDSGSDGSKDSGSAVGLNVGSNVVLEAGLASGSDATGSNAVVSDADGLSFAEASRWVFLSDDDNAGTASGQNGRWMYIPEDTLVPVDVFEDGRWAFIPYGHAGDGMEISDETGRWILLSADMIDNADKYTLPINNEKIKVPDYPDYVLNPDMDMPEMKIDGNKYIGVLKIPSLKLQLPVMGEWSYPKLRTAPCRYTGSVYQNNMIICGHNYDRHFGRLKALKTGADVVFTDADGSVFRYKVTEQETLKPRAVNQMQNGDWDLTLFTCTIGGATRVTVRCERI